MTTNREKRARAEELRRELAAIEGGRGFSGDRLNQAEIEFGEHWMGGDREHAEGVRADVTEDFLEWLAEDAGGEAGGAERNSHTIGIWADRILRLWRAE